MSKTKWGSFFNTCQSMPACSIVQAWVFKLLFRTLMLTDVFCRCSKVSYCMSIPAPPKGWLLDGKDMTRHHQGVYKPPLLGGAGFWNLLVVNDISCCASVYLGIPPPNTMQCTSPPRKEHQFQPLPKGVILFYDCSGGGLSLLWGGSKASTCGPRLAARHGDLLRHKVVLRLLHPPWT